MDWFLCRGCFLCRPRAFLRRNTARWGKRCTARHIALLYSLVLLSRPFRGGRRFGGPRRGPRVPPKEAPVHHRKGRSHRDLRKEASPDSTSLEDPTDQVRSEGRGPKYQEPPRAHDVCRGGCFCIARRKTVGTPGVAFRGWCEDGLAGPGHVGGHGKGHPGTDVDGAGVDDPKGCRHQREPERGSGGAHHRGEIREGKQDRRQDRDAPQDGRLVLFRLVPAGGGFLPPRQDPAACRVGGHHGGVDARLPQPEAPERLGELEDRPCHQVGETPVPAETESLDEAGDPHQRHHKERLDLGLREGGLQLLLRFGHHRGSTGLLLCLLALLLSRSRLRGKPEIRSRGDPGVIVLVSSDVGPRGRRQGSVAAARGGLEGNIVVAVVVVVVFVGGRRIEPRRRSRRRQGLPRPGWWWRFGKPPFEGTTAEAAAADGGEKGKPLGLVFVAAAGGVAGRRDVPRGTDRGIGGREAHQGRRRSGDAGREWATAARRLAVSPFRRCCRC
mmetsp:Transcript_20145/g.41775  ORF Transcript_20145/g.41775 Transcript_20145/m.41775 type:complete len:499 (+) Transcript_20145:81-1577(+)